MNTKKWRQFLIEGDAQTLADQLENELNVKVKPDRDNDTGKVVIYPNKSPGDQVYSSDRMAQRITVKYDGGLELVSIVGYDRSMDLIGEPYSGTSMAMQGIWMPEGGRGIPLSMDALKIYVLQMKRGLEGEAQAQADFYKDNKGYYKQDGRIGVGLSSQPRMK
tara:strand:+ start:84 stop:572 length:489 start_codon:yes stop_codon:yes gene_type:complete